MNRCHATILRRALGAVLGVALAACGGSAGPLDDLGFMRFPSPAESPYCLPYPTGVSAEVTQSWSEQGSHRGRFAYDFALPFGSEVTAARPGTVTEIRNEFSDADRIGGHENGVFVRHDDGTMATYLHFEQGGVVVAVGDEVRSGEVLGTIGTSGTADPHLHFEVFEGQGPRSRWFRSLPVSFANATSPLDDWGGLERATYTATPCGDGA